MTDTYQTHPSNLWATPQWLFDHLARVFDIVADLCATPDTTKCEVYLSPWTDAFTEEWEWPGRAAFMNPPYRDERYKMMEWMQRAADQAEQHDTQIICLVKAATETKWFQVGWDRASAIVFFAKRLAFTLHGEKKDGARFPNALLIFGPPPTDEQLESLTHLGNVIKIGTGGLLTYEEPDAD